MPLFHFALFLFASLRLCTKTLLPALVHFVTTAAEPTQLQNRGADRGPQPGVPSAAAALGWQRGSPLGVVVATGSKSRDHSTAKMTGFHIA
jgi:hypothetical protein